MDLLEAECRLEGAELLQVLIRFFLPIGLQIPLDFSGETFLLPTEESKTAQRRLRSAHS